MQAVFATCFPHFLFEQKIPFSLFLLHFGKTYALEV